MITDEMKSLESAASWEFRKAVELQENEMAVLECNREKNEGTASEKEISSQSHNLS